jgi:ATP-binding cassette subfamily F protein uup
VEKVEEPVEPVAPPPTKSSKLSYKDQRDYEQLPARIEELDDLIAKGEHALSDPDLYASDPEKFTRISKALEQAREEKDAAELRWLELAELVEG